MYTKNMDIDIPCGKCYTDGKDPLLRTILNKKEKTTMDAKEKVLEVMRQAGKPLSAGEVEKLSGLDRKEVDAAFKALKKEEAIVSPVRCKWEPANK